MPSHGRYSHDPWEPPKAVSQVCQEPPEGASLWLRQEPPEGAALWLWQEPPNRRFACLSWDSPKALPRVDEELEQESVLVPELVPVADRSQLLGHRSS